MRSRGSASPSAASTASLFLATTQSISANKRPRALQLALDSDKFHTYTYNFQSRCDLLTSMRINAQTLSSREIFHTSILWMMTAHENTKTMTRQLCCHLDFIYSLKKSSYKCTGCKENSPQEVH